MTIRSHPLLDYPPVRGGNSHLPRATDKLIISYSIVSMTTHSSHQVYRLPRWWYVSAATGALVDLPA